MSNAEDRIIVNLTNRRPVKVRKAEWPRIAYVDTFNGQHECQANTVAKIIVRQHADGRAMVYGIRESGNGGWPIGATGWAGGEIVEAGGDIAAAIMRLDGLDGGFCAIDADALRRAAIAALPAEDM